MSVLTSVVNFMCEVMKKALYESGILVPVAAGIPLQASNYLPPLSAVYGDRFNWDCIRLGMLRDLIHRATACPSRLILNWIKLRCRRRLELKLWRERLDRTYAEIAFLSSQLDSVCASIDPLAYMRLRAQLQREDHAELAAEAVGRAYMWSHKLFDARDRPYKAKSKSFKDLPLVYDTGASRGLTPC